MDTKYRPVAGIGYPLVIRPNSVRYVNPINELNRLLEQIEVLEADVYAQALAKHQALDTVRSWETKYEELEATIKRIEAKLPNWERKPMSDWESIYIGPQQGRNECAMVIRAILKQRDKDDG